MVSRGACIAAFAVALALASPPSARAAGPLAFNCTGPACEPVSCPTHVYKCYNGGYCNPDPLGTQGGVLDLCICPEGYSEAGCTLEVVECPGGKWCTNGGTCGATMCSCPIGFSGARCQVEDEVDTCSNGHHCLNGGQCDVDNVFIDEACLCPDGFAGLSCERRVVRCPGGNYCENGGTCDGSRCKCATGFYGGHCQLARDPVPAPSPAAADDEGKGKGILKDGDMRLTVIIAAPLAFIALATCGFVGYMVRRERRGAPLFTKLEDINPRGSLVGTAKAIEVTTRR